MKKKIISIIALILCTSILIIIISMNMSFAEGTTAEFRLSNVETKVGNKINIELVLTNKKQFLSSDFVVTYDNTKLDYVGYTKGNIENFTICTNESTDGVIKIAGIQDPAEIRTVPANTSIIILQFNVISGTGTESSIELQCNSLYITETQKAQTVENNGNVKILNTAGIAGNIETNNGYENTTAYLYSKEDNVLVDESTVDSSGRYNLEATKAGEYYIKIKKTGYLDFYIRDINVTQTNNDVKVVNDIQLMPGDINNDGEIELLDLVKLNDSYGANVNGSNINIAGGEYINNADRQIIVDNYSKKSIDISIEDLKYKTI